MWEFLTFRTFITQDILIIIYYFGVFFLPVLLWLYRKKVALFLNAYRFNNKSTTILIIIILFLMMQLMWRMLFEAMIGYFDMHDYLQILSTLKQ
jgi:hypothetical protein